MTDITVYKPSRNPNVRDYPDKIDALIDVLQGFITELETARNGNASLDARLDSAFAACAQLSGLTADLNGNSHKITNLAAPTNPSDACRLSDAQALAIGGGTPSNINVTDLNKGAATQNQLLVINDSGAIVGNDAALAAALVYAHQKFN